MNLLLVFAVASTGITETLLNKALSGWSADVAAELLREPVTVSATTQITQTTENGATTFKESITLAEDLGCLPASTVLPLGEETVSGLEAVALIGLAGLASNKTGTLTLSVQ